MPYSTHEKRKKAGVCINCGGPKGLNDGLRCEPCRKHKKNQQEALRKTRYDLGLCWQCPGPRIPNHICCEKCRARDTERIQKQTQRRMLAGLCIRCGVSAPPDQHYCNRCLILTRAGSAHNRDLAQARTGVRSIKPKWRVKELEAARENKPVLQEA